jgi:peptidoglycan/xylan/chitin deacetylase (PgdA/CDA1 family)
MPLPERTVVLTFDDGSADFAGYAWPALVERGLTATLYVTAGALDGTSRQQVVRLADQGCEIGAHSMTGPQLDCLPRTAAAAEIAQSKKVLEHLLARPVDSFAYPHGAYDAGVRQLVVDTGFRSAVAITDALSPAGDDWFALARVRVTADFDVERLTAVVAAPRVLADGPVKRLRTQLWRQARRWPHRPTPDRRVGA